MYLQPAKVIREAKISLHVIDLSCHLFFLFWLCLSVYYYRECTITIDTAQFLFRLPHEQGINKFYIVSDRFPLIIYEVLPVILSFFDVTHETLAISKLLNHWLIHYTIFLTIMYYCKDRKTAIALTIYLATSIRFYFYTDFPIYPEWGFLLHSFMRVVKDRKYAHGMLTLALATILLWLYPLNIFFLLYLLMLHVIKNGMNMSGKEKVVFLLIIVLLVLRVLGNLVTGLLSGSQTYELNHISTTISKISYVVEGNTIWPLIYLWNYLRSGGDMSLIICVLSPLLLSFIRKYAILFATVAFMVIYFVLFILHNATESKVWLAHDVYWSMITFFPIMGLREAITFALPALWKIAIMSSILIVGGFEIFCSRIPFVEKAKYISRLMYNSKKHKSSKLIIDKNNTLWEIVLNPYFLTYEVANYSTYKDEERNSTLYVFVTDQPDTVRWALAEKRSFLSLDFGFGKISFEKINKKNFFIDTNPYKFLNTSVKVYNISIDTIPVHSIEIIVSDTVVAYYLPIYPEIIEVKIYNRNVFTFPSRPERPDNPAYLSYHVYDTAGKQLIWDGFRTPLEADIPPVDTIKTSLVIESPVLPPGAFILEIDLITDGKKWWNINKRTILIVKNFLEYKAG